jgi:hypothetical protein
MRRNVSGWVAGVALAAVVAACGGGNGGGYEGTWGDGVVQTGGCGQYTSCGTCTPVLGCGWCFNASGGQCASRPDECAFSTNAEFTWTWNQSGCPQVDASVVPEPPPAEIDAGQTEASSLDASEASVHASDASGSSADAAAADALTGDAVAVP